MGFVQFATGFSVPLLRRDLEVSRVLASLHNIGWATAVLVLSIILPKHIYKYRPDHLLRLGWSLILIGILGFSFGGHMWITVPSFTLAAIGATIFNNTNSALMGANSGSAVKLMLRITGLSAVLGALSPTLIGVLTSRGIAWNITLSAMSLVIGAIAFISIPHIDKREQGDGHTLKIRWDKSYIFLVLFGASVCWVEVGATTWALDLITDRGLELSAAILFATAINYFAGGSRLLFSFFPRVNVSALWGMCVLLAGSGLLLIIFSTNSALTVAGLLITGFGYGPMAGIVLAHCSDSEQGPVVGVAAFAIGMGPILGIVPWVIGWISESYGFSVAYGTVLAALVTVTFFFLKRPARR